MKTIEIKTTQNVTIEYELATMWARVGAFLLDVLIVGCIYLVLLLMIRIASGTLVSTSRDAESEQRWAMILQNLIPIFLFLSYVFFSEVLAAGQTWGKRATGIRVVSLDGREPGVTDFMLRTVFYFADVFTSAGIIAMLFISASAKGQRLGDMTANTTVVKVNPEVQFHLKDILRIDSTESYTPAFPQVRQLSEQDMLLVKNTLMRYTAHPNQAHTQALNDMTVRLMELLDIEELPRDRQKFLKTLIRDYIVLTR